MNTRNFVLICFLILIAFNSYGQIEQDSISAVQKVEKQVEKQTEIQQLKVPIYKLFPTTNYWTFIKLDTRNGKMWQVHFTISEEGYEGELILNSSSLIWDDKEINGRFTLYPTKNNFNFILLDQLNGTTYQVQWNNDENKRFVSRIY
ncbi:hypothetical protein [Psychroserpens ponticola]|uniref:Uncharacterized protein n=1 Tax=Psychroserpens ponticola TaxID=2932268 RepID=A0ABY7S2B6_9FLAO|nr:hypothetical protein [Psychroserpens ponticola]WCO03535.1 hypothetical protein MUN68_008505 [Psychroserpens ponticola]